VTPGDAARMGATGGAGWPTRKGARAFGARCQAEAEGREQSSKTPPPPPPKSRPLPPRHQNRALDPPPQDLPEDYVCPICGAAKSRFESRVKVVAGFAENQQYGFGTNSMTGNQKLLLIYGTLLLFVAFFLAGYALE
jgi:hypothetical protein